MIYEDTVCRRCEKAIFACECGEEETLATLDRITDAALAYRPKPKTKAAKRRIRRKRRQSKKRESSI